MDSVFQKHGTQGLVWLPELGMGYYPVKQSDMPYDAAYFYRYLAQAFSGIGPELNAARIAFVDKHYQGELLDVGIGCGQFVSSRPNTVGFDVNPVGIEFLEANDKFLALYYEEVNAATFWDSLEHIENPSEAVARVKEWAFVSIPIFDGADHCLRSKHFRKDEHIWYFTHDGIINWFKHQGFECVEFNDMETKIGREGIMTYAFKRCQQS